MALNQESCGYKIQSGSKVLTNCIGDSKTLVEIYCNNNVFDNQNLQKIKKLSLMKKENKIIYLN
jgi:hypothetical protein